MNDEITITLSAHSIDSAIKYLEKYKERLEKRLYELIDRMCADGEAWAIMYLDHVDTGETQSSIIGYREGNIGIVEAGGAAVWIEFGTGVTYNEGGDEVHENRAELGISEWGTYGEGHGADPNGWYYYDKKDGGRRKHTYGIPMDPFMQIAANHLRDTFRTKAKEVFSR